MAAITDIELAAAMNLGDGVSTLSEPISSIVTRLNAVGQAYVQLYIPMAPDAIKNECIVRFASYLYDAPSASADGRFAAAWFNSGASALAAPFMALSVSGTAELAAGHGQPAMGVDQAAVHALISAAVYAWAQAEDLTTIPVAKIPNLPSSKITDLPSGLQPSVALANRVTLLEAFQTHLTYETDYTTNQDIVVAGSRIPYRISTYTWPPDDTAGELFNVSISHRPQAALVHLGTFETTVHAVYEKPQVNIVNVTQLSDTNSITFTLGGIKFYLARDTTDRILFSAEDIDTYTVKIIDKQPDFFHWTHLSEGPSSTIPLNHLPTLSVDKIPTLPASKITGLPTGGSGTLSAADRARLDDLTYTTSTTTPGSTIVARTNVDVFRAGDAYRVGTAKWPDESTATATITVSRRQGSVYTVQGSYDITLTAVYAKAALSAADLGYGTLALTASNATEFRLNSINFYIARLDDDGIAFAANEAFDFAVAIALQSSTTTTSVTDLQDWARVSSSDLIPSTKVSGLPAAGLDRTAVLALIADWAETGNASTVPVAKIPSLPASKITGLPTSGGGGGLTQAQVQALILDWAETGNTDLIPIAKIPDITASKIKQRDSVMSNISLRFRTSNQGITPDNASVWPAKPTTGDITYNIQMERQNAQGVYSVVGTTTVSLNAMYNASPRLGHYSSRPSLLSSNALQIRIGDAVYYLTWANTTRRVIIGPAQFNSDTQRYHRLNIWREYEEIQPWARVENADLIPRAKLAAAHLNTVTARGQATVTASNDAAGSAVAFGSVNQVTEGDIVMISLDPATTSDGNATVITRIPPSQEDVWFSANEFQSESGVTDNVQAKLTNGTSYVSMQLERGSHSTAPKFIRGNYTLYRINA